MLTRLLDYTIRSPLIKTIIFVFSTIVSGVLAAAFVFEISPLGKINWSFTWRAAFFYMILLWVAKIAGYNYVPRVLVELFSQNSHVNSTIVVPIKIATHKQGD